MHLKKFAITPVPPSDMFQKVLDVNLLPNTKITGRLTVSDLKRIKWGGGQMRTFETIVFNWSKTYLELSDLAEKCYGETLQHILDAK